MQSLNQSAIKHKLGLLNLAAALGNVSRVRRSGGSPLKLESPKAVIRKRDKQSVGCGKEP